MNYIYSSKAKTIVSDYNDIYAASKDSLTEKENNFGYLGFILLFISILKSQVSVLHIHGLLERVIL